MPASLKIRLTNQPYDLFLLTGFVLIIISFFKFEQSVDFIFYDTFYVVPFKYLIWILALLFIIAWIIYKLTDKLLWTQKLTWTHVLTTLFVLVLFATTGLWHSTIVPPIKSDGITIQNIIDDQKRERVIGYSLVTIFLLGQAAYFINLIVGIIKRRLT